MGHNKQYQERGVHCDLWGQRLASWKSFKNKSTTISYLQFNKYVSFSSCEMERRNSKLLLL
jgi:hypothetical protein